MELNNITNTGTWSEQATRLNDNFNKVALGIDTLQEMYQSLSQNAIEVVDTLPQTGQANKIYRLVGTTSYSDYMYNADDLTTPILMATYNNAIDNVPTAGSDNLVKSGGVYKVFAQEQSYLEKYGNLMDLNNPLNIYGMSLDNNGNIVPFAAGSVSYPIKVEEGKVYIFGGWSVDFGVRLEDQDGNKVTSFTVGKNVQPYTYTIPIGQNIQYVRVSAITEGTPYLGKQYQENNDLSLANSSHPYVNAQFVDSIDTNNLFHSDSPENIKGYGLNTIGGIVKYSGFDVSHKIQIKGEQLVKHYNQQENKAITSTGDIVTFSGAVVSDGFDVDENTEYTFFADGMHIHQICIRFEDEDGNKVGYELFQEQPHTFTSPAGAKKCFVPLKLQDLPQKYVGMSKADNYEYVGANPYLLSAEDNTLRAIRFEDQNGENVGSVTTNTYPFNLLGFGGADAIRIGSINSGIKVQRLDDYEHYPLQGKKVCLYGDSITVDYYSKVYQAFIKVLTKAGTVERYGMSGGDYANALQSNTYLDPLIASNPDVVIIHSVNSHRASTQIGNNASVQGEQSEIGGLKTIVNRLIASNKNVKIYFCTPLCYGDVKELGYQDSFGSTSPNLLGFYMSDYVKAEYDFCRINGIPVIPLSSECGFRDSVESFAATRVYTLDGCHPNYEGYKVMTKIIANYINK